ncbi:MAG: RDD family protein [Candidatus Melainabacteria bacterium]|jgi:uncharacterized RDD family membrane protein YckC
MTPVTEIKNQPEEKRRSSAAWKRFFARMFDGWISAYPLAFLVGILAIRNPEIFGNRIISSLLVLLLWTPFEALWLSVVGSTPGKWLMGVSVKDLNGSKPTFKQALFRAIGITCVVGIPFVNLFLMSGAKKKLIEKGFTDYDSNLFTVNITELKWWKILIFVIGFVGYVVMEVYARMQNI